MKPSDALAANCDAIRRVVERNRARNPRVFGSVLRGEDTETSDLDLLVDPTPDTTLFDLARILGELQDLLGVPVDVATPNALADSYRATVLAEAEPLEVWAIQHPERQSKPAEVEPSSQATREEGVGQRPSIALEANREAIRRIVALHRGLNPRVFGCVFHAMVNTDSTGT